MLFRTDWLKGDPSEGQARRLQLMVLPLVAAGLLLGLSISLENWRLMGATAGLLLLLVWPIETAVGLYALLIPWEDLTVVSQGSDRTTLLWYAGGIAILVLVSIGLIRRSTVTPPRAALFWSLFILWAASSTLWAIKPEEALVRIPTAASLWLLYLAAVSVRITRKELSWIVLMVVAGGCTASLYSISQYFHGAAIADLEGHRASLVGSTDAADPNFFAASLLLPLSMAIGEALSCRNGLRRIIMLGAVGAIAFAVFLTMSRGALFSVLVVAFVFSYSDAPELAPVSSGWRCCNHVARPTQPVLSPLSGSRRYQGRWKDGYLGSWHKRPKRLRRDWCGAGKFWRSLQPACRFSTLFSRFRPRCSQSLPRHLRRTWNRWIRFVSCGNRLTIAGT